MQLTIHNINNLKTIDYRELTNLQGDLKELDEQNEIKLKNVLEKRGFRAPVFVYRDKGGSIYLMDGHQRQAVMTKYDMNDNGNYAVPYVEIPAKDLQEAQAILLEITSQYGTLTKEGLDNYLKLAKLPVAETMKLVNFDALRAGSDKKKPKVKEDEAPELNETVKPSSVEGGVYQLGRHRVMCASSTDSANVQRLMGDVRADLYLTDPPYNVDYTGKTKDALKIENDKKTDGDFLIFLSEAFKAATDVMKDGAAFYIWHADSEGFNFRGACKTVGLDVRECLVWVKNSMVLGRQDYQWRHEPCLYGWKAGAAHSWYSDRKQTTVLEFDRPTRSTEHPTMKPIALLAYQLDNSTKEGDVVLDSFLGSGSTLIAAEQMNRTCYGLELDPRFVDVIRKRYWKLTHDDKEDGWEAGTPLLQP